MQKFNEYTCSEKQEMATHFLNHCHLRNCSYLIEELRKVCSEDSMIASELEDFVSYDEEDDTYDEPYEYYIVCQRFEYFAKEYTGLTVIDVSDLTVWGRYYTGQWVGLDCEVQRMAYEFCKANNWCPRKV